MVIGEVLIVGNYDEKEENDHIGHGGYRNPSLAIFQNSGLAG